MAHMSVRLATNPMNPNESVIDMKNDESEGILSLRMV